MKGVLGMPDVPNARLKGRRRSGLTVTREIRRAGRVGIQVRDLTVTGDNVEVVGTPIVYDTPYDVYDAFGTFEETMCPGVAAPAFGQDVRFLLGHDDILPLARTGAGTMTLVNATEGLGIQAGLDRRQTRASDLLIALERGDLTQMSCGFTVAMDEWSADYSQRSVILFHELFEVSAVTFPASPTTSVGLGARAANLGIRTDVAGVRRAMDMLGDARKEARGLRLHEEAFPLLLSIVELCHRVDDASGVSARSVHVYKALREARQGKVLSAENAGLLQQALEALHDADDLDIPSIVKSLQDIDTALDAGQAALAELSGNANPDGDAEDQEPELTDDAEPVEEPGTDNDDGAGAAQGENPGASAPDATGMRNLDAMTTMERRAVLADMTYSDVQCTLNDALCAKYQPVVDDPDVDCDWVDLWVRDNTNDWVVWKSYGPFPEVGLWKAPFVIDETGGTTIGDPVQVQIETTYVPVIPASSGGRSASVLALELERMRLRGRRRPTPR